MADPDLAPRDVFRLGFARGAEWAVDQIKDGASPEEIAKKAAGWTASLPPEFRVFVAQQEAREDPYHDA